jgi:hypothetical protein
MDDRCPKCSQKKAAPTQEACVRCGLVFALWNPDNAPKVVALDEGAETLWSAVAKNWSDVEAHDAFLKYCSVASMLPAAGRRYRERLDEQPSDEIAQQMQKRILAMATAAMGSPAQKPPEPFTRSGAFWVVIVGALSLGIIAAMMFRKK